MSKAQDALIEILTGELPPKALLNLSNAFSMQVEQELIAQGLAFNSIQAFATPRRLALIIKQLAAKQSDQVIEKRGPALQAAFDKEGKASPAAEGFARSCGTTVAELEKDVTDKGSWLTYRSHKTGEAVEKILPAIIEKALKQLPVPKMMRWGNSDIQFIRPIHAITMLYGKKIMVAEILGVKTSNKTLGHRFHAPQAIKISSAETYAKQLKKAYVIADFAERQQSIKEQITQLAHNKSGQPIFPEGLLDEVTSLVEYPVALLGEFDKRFLELPREVLISVLQQHQKCFAVEASNGKLLAYFITVSNIKSSDPAVVVAGNQRVILARFSDAAFFYQQDQNQALSERSERLASILFEKQLGTLQDKTLRVAELTRRVAANINADINLAERAALLSKADLTTNMVSEFPELQGLIGCYYARLNGETDMVAVALDEQYKPRFSGDVLPKTAVGQALAIADRIDTLVGIFGIKQGPTGEKDPYALRRAALGVLRLCIEKRLDVDLFSLIKKAMDLYGSKLINPNTAADVLQFLQERHKHLSLREGFTADIFAAVQAVDPARLFDFQLRMQAVKLFKTLPEAESLAAANKRVKNILEKNNALNSPRNINETLLQETAERELFIQIQALKKQLVRFHHIADYQGVLKLLSTLRPYIDSFFDKVMVMVDDPLLQHNRIALLGDLRHLFLNVADISELQA